MERSDTIAKEAKPTQLVVNIVDGGGGKICDEAEGEGAVDYNVDDDIDGGGIRSFQIWLKFAKFGGRFGAGVDILDPSRVEHFPKRSIFRLNTTTNR